jgi:dTDP-4-dehydrorhamnose reductase
MIKIVVIGSNEPLGIHIVANLEKDKEILVIPLTDRMLNISNFNDTRMYFEKIKPKVVINCIEYNLVDKAQVEPRKTFLLNKTGPSHLAVICKAFNITLIHFSTDYIFGKGGGAHRSYTEQDQPNPPNVYGISKFEGEEEIRNTLREHLIFRTSWLFDSIGTNFVKTIVDLIQAHNDLRVVDDQYGNPTWVKDVADMVEIVCKKISNKEEISWGTYHYCGKDYISRYHFVLEIIEQISKMKKIHIPIVTPISSQEYPLPAKRPYWSVLDCTKFTNTFGIDVKDWKIGLHSVLEDLVLRSK